MWLEIGHDGEQTVVYTEGRPSCAQRKPGEGGGSPLQDSRPEGSVDRGAHGAWQLVHGVAEPDTTE